MSARNLKIQERTSVPYWDNGNLLAADRGQFGFVAHGGGNTKIGEAQIVRLWNIYAAYLCM